MATLDKKAIVKFLRTVNIMTLAVSGSRGPISSPFLFAVEDDLSAIYIATHRDSFKAQALLKDPRVGASVWQFDHMLIQIDGIATEITEASRIPLLVDKLVDSLSRLNGFWPPVLQIEGEEYVVFSIKPTWVRALDLTHKQIISGDNPFVEITV